MSVQITITNFFKGRIGHAKIIDFVEKKLLEQGKRSIKTEGVRGQNYCRYRGIDNCKCGVGHLIPDSRYNPMMDQGVVGAATLVFEFSKELDIEVPKFADKEFEARIKFLQGIQTAHDTCTDDSSFSNQIQDNFAILRSIYVLKKH